MQLDRDALMLIPVLTPFECDALIKDATRCAEWETATIDRPAVAARAVEEEIRVADVLRERSHPEIFSAARRRLEAALRLSPASDLASGLDIRPMQLVRYKPGGFYRLHRDRPLDGEHPRLVSVVCYLNDDFAGGTTTFPEHGYVQQPLQGSAIVFPAHYQHIGDAVEGGIKFVIVTWL